MAIFRQYIAPLLIVLVFLVALLAVTSRIFLVEDMAAPAPMEDVAPKVSMYPARGANLPPSLSALITGLTDETAF